jgi:hypothetical protein
LIDEGLAEDPVAVSQQVVRCGVPRKSFAELLGGPLSGGMSRYVEMDDTATLVAQDHEHVENLETDRRHGEEVNRHQGLDVILQEGSPGLGGRSAPANHVLADARLANIDAQLEEFPVDARSTPQWVFSAHPADQFSNLDRKAWTTGLAMAHFPGPEKPESFPMPADDGLGLNDH